jgi:hypothetical protein
MLLLALLMAASTPPDLKAELPRMTIMYDTPHGVVTLVTSDGPVRNKKVAPDLTFKDEAGETVRVYADATITVAEARSYLKRSRAEYDHADIVRRRIEKSRP